MEQLGPTIQFVSKYRFWFISGLVTLVAVGVWFVANSQLYRQRLAAQQNIQQQISDIDRIKKTGANLAGPSGLPANAVVAHPNETTKLGMLEETRASLRSLLAAWRLRREAQESILQWPLEILGSKEFVSIFSQFDPPEKFASIPDTGFSNLLTIYKDSIPRRMPEICDIIGAKWEFTPPPGAKGSAGPRDQAAQGSDRGLQISGNMEIDTRTYTVQWNKDNQALWNMKLTRFKDVDGNKKEYPSPYQVLALQQDLWLLEAMFKIIKEINGEETATDFATIKTIHYVVFGREARMDDKRALTTPDPRLARKQGGERTSPTFNPDERDDRGGMLGSPGNEGQDTAPKFDPKLTDLVELGPFHGRYVDQYFQPIPVKAIHDVLNSDTLPDQNLELIVAKRVPVRIALRMDERKIADFIAACRNSPFTFEIELVRVNCDVSGKDIKVFGDAASSARGDDRGAGFSVSGGAGGTGASASDVDSSGTSGGQFGELDPAKIPVEVRTNYDVNVEFFGIVKIYNHLGPEEEKRFRNLLQEDGAVTANTAGSTTVATANRP